MSTYLLVCQDLERCLQDLIDRLSWLICVLLHKPVQRVVSFHVEHGTYLVDASSEVDDRTHSCFLRQEPHKREPKSSLPQDLLRLMLSGYEISTLLPEKPRVYRTCSILWNVSVLSFSTSGAHSVLQSSCLKYSTLFRNAEDSVM